jgi:Reverse transcriptase (RNA-dependent DNA polymerase)
MQKQFKEVFNPDAFLPPHRLFDCKINIPDNIIPVPKKLKPLSWNKREVLSKYIEDLLKVGHIEESLYPFASGTIMVRKPDNSSRICIDYRSLNSHIPSDNYPLPLFDDLLSTISGKRVFSKLDLRNAYNQLRMTLGHEGFTSFRCFRGNYEYRVLPFGLTNAPATFQRFMSTILSPLRHERVQVYLDDILISTRDASSNYDLKCKTLEILKKNNLRLKLEKCIFNTDSVEYLVFIITKFGLKQKFSKFTRI